MERLLNDDLQNQIKEMLSIMKEKVNIVFFGEENENSQITEKLLEEIAPLNELINLTKFSFKDGSEEAKKYNVTTAPAYVVFGDSEDSRGVFYGVPAGHEINTLLTTIVDVSKAMPLYESDVLDQIELINKPTNIKVFVTTSCPHCPGAAINALRLAQLNKNINAEVFEVQTNMEIGNKYKVSGVPKILINETEELMGNQPIEAFLQTIIK